MVASRRGAFAEEAAEVEVLFANLEKMKSLSKKIQVSMSRLDSSGRVVQDAIGPIYGNTQRLQTTTLNVNRIMAAIERAKEPLDMRNKEELILRSRPDKVGLNEYIASIDRTVQALRELKATNLRSNQKTISDLNALLAMGTQNLEDVFRDFLRQESQPIEPLKQITTGTEFPRFPSNKSTQLRSINTQIAAYTQLTVSNELSPCAKTYASERGQYITLSLQNLATASISTARKVNADAIYNPGSCAIGSYAQGVLGMYTAEYDNICPVFSRDDWGPVLQATCKNSLSAFTNTLNELDSHIKRNVLTDCYLAYEIMDVVSKTSFQLEEKTGELKLPMSNALKPVRETAKSTLSLLLNDVRSKTGALQSLPFDGGALPLTTEIMTRLQRMTSYLSPLSSIMRSLGAGGWSTSNITTSTASIPTLKSFDVGADGKQLFAHYSIDTVEAHLNALDVTSKRVFKSKGTQGVFLANTIAVIERMIRASDLDPLLVSAQAKLDVWKKRTTQMYLDGWREPSAHLLDVQYTSKAPRPPSTGQAIDSGAVLKALSSKDKDGIKEKFRNFNSSFDDLIAKHKAFRMEPEVRRQLAKDVHNFIEPLYFRFWDRYHEIDKGKGKYVKYDKTSLSSTLASLE